MRGGSVRRDVRQRVHCLRGGLRDGHAGSYYGHDMHGMRVRSVLECVDDCMRRLAFGLRERGRGRERWEHERGQDV